MTAMHWNFRRLKVWEKTLVGLVLLIVIYALLGFWAVPAILKSLLAGKLSESLGHPVTVQSIRFNPFSLRLSLDGLHIADGDPSSTAASLESFDINIQAESLFRRKLVAQEIVLVGPFAHIVRRHDGCIAFLGRADNESDEKKPDESGDLVAPIPFALEDIEIRNGALDLTDEVTGQEHRIRDVNFLLPTASSEQESPGWVMEPTLLTQINGSPLVVYGSTQPFSPGRETRLNLHIARVDLPSYLAYAPIPPELSVTSAMLDVGATLDFSKDQERNADLKLSGQIGVDQLEVIDTSQKDLFKFSSLTVPVISAEPLKKRVELGRVALAAPQLQTSLNKQGKLNLTSLLPPHEQPPEEGETPEAGGEPFFLNLEAFDIVDGEVGFADQTPAEPVKMHLKGLSLSLTGFSTEGSAPAAFECSAKTEIGETLHAKGQFTLQPLNVEGALDVTGIDSKKYRPYYENRLQFDIRSGKIDASSRFLVSSRDGRMELELSDLDFSLKSVLCNHNASEQEFLNVPMLTAKDCRVNLGKREIIVPEIAAEKGVLGCKREKDGSFDLSRLVPAVAEPSPPGGAPPEKPTEPNPWQVIVKNASLNSFRIQVEDQVPSEPVTMVADDLNLSVKDYALVRSPGEESAMPVTFACTLNGAGTISIDGKVDIEPLTASLKVNLGDIDLTPARAYIPEHIKVQMNGGKLYVAGQVDLSKEPVEGFKASFQGEASLADFSSSDRLKGEEFLSWKGLALKGLEAGTHPKHFHIATAESKGLFARVSITQDKKVNLIELFSGGAPPAASAAQQPPPPEPPKVEKPVPPKPSKGKSRAGRSVSKPAPQPESVQPAQPAVPAPAPMLVKIDRIVLEDGQIDFSDEHIQPHFRTLLLDIAGTISGLFSEKGEPAQVNLTGNLGKGSPLSITGKINPFQKELFADLTLKFQNIDLTRMNPYAQRYVGYNLEKGNLQLELQYLVVKRKLDSQNRIQFDQLTFGDKVDSPDATTLPVRFAMSLLQDRSGEISLAIPVKGNIDDPKFSLGAVIWKALSNVILKVVSAPFALLGGLFGGGGEDLGSVEFGAGKSDLPDDAAKKMESIEKILYERPGLQLDLEGQAEKGRDAEALRIALFEEKIKSTKLRETDKKSEGKAGEKKAAVAPQENEAIIRQIFVDEGGPADAGKKFPLDEIKKQILSKIEVTEEALKSLAYRRATQVRDRLLQTGRIDGKRIFLIDPKVMDSKDGKGGRVNLKLK